MDKLEKVIKGLEYCAASCKGVWDEVNGCPYMSEWTRKLMNEKDVNGRCVDLLAKDALELLKAQEPVKPITQKGRRFIYFKCGNCCSQFPQNEKPNYCSNCGRAVKWDG